jgi:hypothetical protein
MLHALLAGGLAAVLSACASVQPTEDAQPQRRVGQTVEIGREASAPVGGVIFGQFDYRAAIRAVAQDNYQRQVLNAVIRVNAGQPLFRSLVGGSREGWCSANPTYFTIIGAEARSACFLDGQGRGSQIGRTGRFSEAYVVNTAVGTELSVDIPYRIDEIAAGGGFRYELIYQGFDRGVVRVTYREFVDSMARPAFQQDLSYTLEPGGRPTTVSFRSVRLEILSADNNSIRYRVLSAFQ